MSTAKVRPKGTKRFPANYADRVARGAALLDRERPGWAAEIAIDELAMASCNDCILGQIYGRYTVGLSSVFRDTEASWLSPAHYGFTLYDGEQVQDFKETMLRFRELADAWRTEIRART